MQFNPYHEHITVENTTIQSQLMYMSPLGLQMTTLLLPTSFGIYFHFGLPFLLVWVEALQLEFVAYLDHDFIWDSVVLKVFVIISLLLYTCVGREYDE